MMFVRFVFHLLVFPFGIRESDVFSQNRLLVSAARRRFRSLSFGTRLPKTSSDELRGFAASPPRHA